VELHLVRRRGPYQNGEVRRRQIITVATAVFGTDGYVGGSLRQIAAQVGVTEPALLRHFGSKSALLLATLAHWETQMEITEAYPQRIEATRLGLLRAHVAKRHQLEEPRQLYAVITAEASAYACHPARAFIAERHARQIALLADLLVDASRLGETMELSPARAESEACVILALLQGLELQCHLDPAANTLALLDRYLDTALRRGTHPLEAHHTSAHPTPLPKEASR
jgi:AcrR family transcriptional regulator